MPALGKLNGSEIGAHRGHYVHAIGGGFFTTFAMAGINSGWAARFIPKDARDVLKVRVNFALVTAPGTIRCRIETDDGGATGKPSGTLVDANATIDFTPAAGWNTLTFATPPTAGFTPGASYYVVLLTTVGGTTMTLNSSQAEGTYPTVVLTAADGTTRTNFAEVASGTPVLSLEFEDGVEEADSFCPYGSLAALATHGTNSSGMKFTLQVADKFAGVRWIHLRSGTPAGDLAWTIYDSSNAPVSGATVSIDKDALVNSSARVCKVMFPAPVTLPAGTYRVLARSSGSASSANGFDIRGIPHRDALLVPDNMCQTTTTDIAAGTPTFTDTAANLACVSLIRDEDVTASGGSHNKLHGKAA